jgi:hypothetical protein
MGDRTDCTLLVHGTTTAALWAEVEKALENFSPVDEGDDTENRFVFYEVNYARLPDDLEAALISAGLSFEWSWSAGGCYAAGVSYYDAENKSSCEFARIEQEICLTVSELQKPERVAQAIHWANRTFPAFEVTP